MESKISEAIRLKYQPVALIRTDRKPDNAMQFKQGKWGCIMWLAANAAKGNYSVCDRETFGCVGGGVGMGFGNQYKNFPGGEDCFSYFLSSGNEQWEQGKAVGEQVRAFMSKDMFDEFMHGERYFETPDKVHQFIEYLPMTDIREKYVVFKPLRDISPETEMPHIVIFFADPDQISALTVLANYGREDNQNVIIPYAAGCQTLGIYPYREAESDKPRAVVGLTDISARVFIRKMLGDHLMSFAIPFAMFSEMENNVEHSFLNRPRWLSLVKSKMDDTSES